MKNRPTIALFSILMPLVLTLSLCSKQPTESGNNDPSGPPPAPTNLVATYDTLLGYVTLTWDPVLVEDLDGYVLYRNLANEDIPERVTASLIEDTTYADTIFYDRVNNKGEHIFIYRLKAQDEDANLSTVYSKSVRVYAATPLKVRTKISFESLNTRNDTASINDTVGIAVAYHNETRDNVLLEWFVDNGEYPVRTVDDTTRSGEDTLLWAWEDTSVKKVSVAVTDDDGTVWHDSIKVLVLQDNSCG